MSEATLAERLAFLELRDADRRHLRELRPVLEKHADEIVSVFYRHLLSFERTRSFLLDPEVKKRLLAKQRAYLLSLVEARIDQSYIEDRMRIGETHMRVGLEPKWYLGAYALYMKLLSPILIAHHRNDPAAGERSLLTLHKILMLDAQLAMEAYIERREQQLEYLNRELGEASRELRRIYDRQADELRETSERAHAAEELASVATLVAGLAHEIGTPMGVIQGHAELLESSVQDERGRWRLQTIRDQIDRITTIIQTLLNMARPHQRQRVPVDLGALTRDSLAFLSEKFRSRGIHPEITEECRTTVLGDPEKLQQLLLNLFLNSCDAMPKGGELQVTLGQPEDGEAEIRVRDSGQGMPEAVRTRVFEPFYTTKEAGRGSGLGLMVAQGIVHDHGGRISVESVEGQGTEFRIVLPLGV